MDPPSSLPQILKWRKIENASFLFSLTNTFRLASYFSPSFQGGRRGELRLSLSLSNCVEEGGGGEARQNRGWIRIRQTRKQNVFLPKDVSLYLSKVVPLRPHSTKELTLTLLAKKRRRSELEARSGKKPSLPFPEEKAWKESFHSFLPFESGGEKKFPLPLLLLLRSLGKKGKKKKQKGGAHRKWNSPCITG